MSPDQLRVVSKFRFQYLANLSEFINFNST